MSDVYGQPISGPQAPQGRSFWDIASQTWPVQMAQHLWNAAKLPGDVYQGNVSVTGPDGYTNPEVINRSADLAGMMTMGATAAPAETNAVGMGIRAYHGSPYDFDKFDLSKIGTGEGAQAYGHGLYFAENPATAQSYRDTLQGKGFNIPEDVAALPDEQRLAILRAANAHGAQPDPLEAAKRAQWASPDLRSQPLESIADKIARSRPPDGRMYEVNINADPQQFLDWDKPLSQQPGVIPDSALMRSYKPSELGAVQSLSGSSVYKRLSLTGPQGASSALNEAGVPGIKYLDQGSRAAGDGSRNYVVFNPQIIDILKKYGIAGLGLTGAGLGALPAPHIQSQ